MSTVSPRASMGFHSDAATADSVSSLDRLSGTCSAPARKDEVLRKRSLENEVNTIEQSSKRQKSSRDGGDSSEEDRPLALRRGAEIGLERQDGFPCLEDGSDGDESSDSDCDQKKLLLTAVYAKCKRLDNGQDNSDEKEGQEQSDCLRDEGGALNERDCVDLRTPRRRVWRRKAGKKARTKAAEESRIRRRGFRSVIIPDSSDDEAELPEPRPSETPGFLATLKAPNTPEPKAAVPLFGALPLSNALGASIQTADRGFFSRPLPVLNLPGRPINFESIISPIAIDQASTFDKVGSSPPALLPLLQAATQAAGPLNVLSSPQTDLIPGGAAGVERTFEKIAEKDSERSAALESSFVPRVLKSGAPESFIAPSSSALVGHMARGESETATALEVRNTDDGHVLDDGTMCFDPVPELAEIGDRPAKLKSPLEDEGKEKELSRREAWLSKRKESLEEQEAESCMREEKICEKEKSLDDRAAALLDEEQKLRRRAEVLEEREGKVGAREVGAQKEEEGLCKKVAELLETERKLKEEEARLRMSMEDLRKRENDVGNTERKLKQKEEELKGEWKTLEKKEREVNEKQAALVKMERAAVEKERQVREMEGRVEDWQADVGVKQESVQKREDGLKRREVLVKIWEESVQIQENAVKEREEIVGVKECSLQQLGGTLKEREESVKNREDTVQEKEDGFQAREETVKKREESVKTREESVQLKEESIKLVLKSAQAKGRRLGDLYKELLVDVSYFGGGLPAEAIIKKGRDSIEALKLELEQHAEGLEVSQEGPLVPRATKQLVYLKNEVERLRQSAAMEYLGGLEASKKQREEAEKKQTEVEERARIAEARGLEVEREMVAKLETLHVWMEAWLKDPRVQQKSIFLEWEERVVPEHANCSQAENRGQALEARIWACLKDLAAKLEQSNNAIILLQSQLAKSEEATEALSAQLAELEVENVSLRSALRNAEREKGQVVARLNASEEINAVLKDKLQRCLDEKVQSWIEAQKANIA